MNAHLTFTTDFFKPVEGEEEQTNPGIFGQQLSEWLSAELKKRGLPIEGAVAEDFGWAVIVSRTPVLLWLACGNTDGTTNEWNIYPVAEPSLFQRLFKRVDPTPELNAIWDHVRSVVPTIPGVKDIRWEE